SRSVFGTRPTSSSVAGLNETVSPAPDILVGRDVTFCAFELGMKVLAKRAPGLEGRVPTPDHTAFARQVEARPRARERRKTLPPSRERRETRPGARAESGDTTYGWFSAAQPCGLRATTRTTCPCCVGAPLSTRFQCSRMAALTSSGACCC